MAATSYSTDPTLYLYTSLTAGSSHIITATSRLETILKANKIPFRALDCATDEKARMLWGRRSKGRKLPGLVKYGEIIGDLEQIEEWNEYGELKEQIAATQDFGGLATTTNLAPQVPATSASSSGPPSRASSETRHISIAEPTEKEKHTAAGDAKPALSQKSAESHMNMAIRQLGAEAAAKATQKKGATAQPAKAAAVPTKGQSTTDQVPTATAERLSTEAAAESADTAKEVTAAKTPAQLASEGAARTSVDKIAESRDKLIAGGGEEAASSKEEQILEIRRSSSITKSKSRLSDVTPIEESDKVLAEQPDTSTASQSSIAVPKNEINVGSSTSLPQQAAPRRQHRGSDIGEATPEEIRALEKKLSIPEEDDDGDDAVEMVESKATDVSSSDKGGNEAAEGMEPQKTEPKDADKAGVSVGD
ncbi:uncharacterized protein Z519_12341 [Cladophialophora bantiana CBS 173.52]|uniref:Glutaredoxin domain-containing protein n=1 Tax=Cladophialophora bantiana (strain ATCC 10958 / CBS 173.52 / CDC B-1940 / NIH 8579) TaxID=1442370 RepID=A0A0D2HRP8_CLAB1|nr:uncharacterized protein Z519_12341 [Cladophialophora bantiana CBS 173.52]KIW87044.1 hypothetical protein Z519_12341 [Cladophialophora bantiana CBS 173.52]